MKIPVGLYDVNSARRKEVMECLNAAVLYLIGMEEHWDEIGDKGGSIRVSIANHLKDVLAKVEG